MLLNKLLVLAAILTIICESRKNSPHNIRHHSNLYSQIKPGDIQKIIKFDPFLMLLLGHKNESIFEKYKGAMHDYAIKHSINKNWLHFGYMDVRHFSMLKEKYEIKKFPVLLHFFDGELVMKDYRFNISINPEADLDIKFLHSILEIEPSLEEIKQLLKDNLCAVFLDVGPEEKIHFDVSLQERINFLKISAEVFAGLPKDEFVFIGLDFTRLSEQTKEFLISLHAKDFEGILLYSQDSERIYEISKQTVLDKKGHYLKDWIYHHSHGYLADPQLAYKNIVKRKNYGMVFFHSSNNNTHESLTKKGIVNFEKTAKILKGKIQFTLCDIYLQKTCEELYHLFELENKQLPFIRVLYSSISGKTEQFRAFKLQQDFVEGELKKNTKTTEMEIEMSEEGIKRLVSDFKVFDVDLDVKMEKVPEKDIVFIQKAGEILKKHKHADLELNYILTLNYVVLKDFVDFIKFKDRVIFFYDSRKHLHAKNEFQKSFDLFFENKQNEKIHKYFVFAFYDISKNTRHGIDIDVNNLPIMRYYRKEENINSYYNDRFLIKSRKDVVNGIIDLCNFDLFIDTEEI
jgi:hypothetical protein